MRVCGTRRLAFDARTRARSAMLLVLVVSACASQKPVPAASPRNDGEIKAGATTAVPSGPPTESAAEAPLPAAPEQPTAGSTDAADPKINDDRAVVITDASASSPATPDAAVPTEPDQAAGPANATPRPPPSDPCERPDVSEVPVIDAARDLLEEQTCGAALWLDGLFGDKGNEDAARRTRGVLEVSNVYSEFEGFNMRARLHVEVDLPTMKNRLSAFVGRENDEDFVRGRTEASELRATFPTLSEQNEWLAGLGYSLPDSRNLQTSVRVGVRGLGPPTGFVQGRARYTLYSDDNDVAYIKTTPFWNTTDGFGLTQSFDYSRVLSKRHLLRWYSVATVSERSVGMNWRNSAILYHNLNHKRGLAYEAFIRGETDEPEPLYEYGGRALYRHPFMRQRLFAEWAAGYSFPRTDPNLPRDGSANVGLSIELPFGEPRD